MKELLLNYTRYNRWANKRLCDFLKDNLSEEQLNMEMISSFPSVQKTLFHCWGAQYIWLQRLEGISLASFPGKNLEGSFTDVVNGLLETSQQLVDYVEAGNEKLFSSELVYKNIAGDEFKNNISDILLHVENHSTFHRGQIITMLRQLGFTKLFPTDYIAFCRE